MKNRIKRAINKMIFHKNNSFMQFGKRGQYVKRTKKQQVAGSPPYLFGSPE